MARARNIKPSLFTNEILGTLDPMVSLTFVGLWCLADKDGILEDRPMRIKGELFPYRDGLDVNGYLTVLQLHGFVIRYKANGLNLIQVINFEKHQHPHHTERAKGYPKPTSQGCVIIDVPGKESLTPLSNGYATENIGDSPSDSGFLIPDSLLPDSLIDRNTDVSQAPEKKSSKKPQTEYPADFYPNQTGLDLAAKHHMDVASQLERFQDHHLARGNTFSDWQAAWRTWCGNAQSFSRAPTSIGRDRQPPQSFAERDREAGMKRWEEQTGRVHPDRVQPSGAQVIDITPTPLELAND